MAEGGFVRRLGEAGYGRDDGCVGVLDVLAHAGLPVPGGVVLTRRTHEEFMTRALVTVGSRRLGLAGRLKLGSVWNKVLGAAEGPVLVYPRVV